MRFRISLLAIGWLLLAIGLRPAAAQNPFAGTWKMDQEKSQMTGNLLQFGPAAGDAIELKARGTTYSFRTDGKTYALPSGNAAIWRQTSPDSWTTEYRKLDNKLLYIDNWKLSPDAATLTVTTSGARADGDLYTDKVVYARSAGSGGLMGTWKSTTVKLSSPSVLTIQEHGLDRLDFSFAATKSHSELSMDGKDAAVIGPDVPAGLRLSLTRTGPYSLQLVRKMNGTATRTVVYTLTADEPKIMTEVGGSPGDPPATIVWERQAPPVKKEAAKPAPAGKAAHP